MDEREGEERGVVEIGETLERRERCGTVEGVEREREREFEIFLEKGKRLFFFVAPNQERRVDWIWGGVVLDFDWVLDRLIPGRNFWVHMLSVVDLDRSNVFRTVRVLDNSDSSDFRMLG